MAASRRHRNECPGIQGSSLFIRRCSAPLRPADNRRLPSHAGGAQDNRLVGKKNDTTERVQASYDGTNNRFEFVLSEEVYIFNAEIINGAERYPI